MRIKKKYTREQLEHFSVRRIKRTFMIARQAMFTKMRLIDKVMKRMDEVYPEARGDVVDEDVFMRWLHLKRSDKVKEKEITADISQCVQEHFYDDTNYLTDDTLVEEPEPTLSIPSREELESTGWKELIKRYKFIFSKGVTKKYAIEKILAGEFKLKQ